MNLSLTHLEMTHVSTIFQTENDVYVANISNHNLVYLFKPLVKNQNLQSPGNNSTTATRTNHR